MALSSAIFDQICIEITGASRGVMFGAPCLKTPNGKAAVCLYKDWLVLKPDAELLKEILALDGAAPFDPSGKRAMAGWVQVGIDYQNYWKSWTQRCVDYVAALEAKPAKKKK